MNLLERVLTLLRANLDTVVEKAEDPEKVLRQLQVDMRNQLVQVKTQVATAIAESHRLQKLSQGKRAEAETWLKKAEHTVQQGNDEAARAALSHYNDILKQAARYQQLRQEQEQLVTTMRSALRQLEAKHAEVETTLDILTARKRNALIQQRVFEALQKTTNQADKEQVAKARDAVLDAEARAQALAALHQRNLDTQLEQLSREQLIEHQLQALKQQSSDQPPQRQMGKPQLQTGKPPLLPVRSETSQRASRRRSRQDEEATTLSPSEQEHLQRLLDEIQPASSEPTSNGREEQTGQ
jgi:phage shock protein A